MVLNYRPIANEQVSEFCIFEMQFKFQHFTIFVLNNLGIRAALLKDKSRVFYSKLAEECPQKYVYTVQSIRLNNIGDIFKKLH